MASSANRGGDPVRAGDAVGELLGGTLGRGLSAAARAARAWYAANGDRERAHTTGVWLRKSGKAGVGPVMVVELDSNLLANELGMNKDLYLQRLAFRGVAVSNIHFKPGRPGTKSPGSARPGAASDADAAQTLPDLTAAELDRVERACANLPDGLRQSVSRAMCASLRRSKANHPSHA